MPLTADDVRDITFDLSTLTLGEAAEAERQSGLSIGEIAKSRTSIKMLGMFVHGLRHSDEPPNWSELSNLRLLDVSSSTSRGQPADPSAKSKA